LREIFGAYGEMTKCKLVQKDGRSRGIAFVEYESAASALKAIKSENGVSHAGRQISVELSGKKPEFDAPRRHDDRGSAETNCVFCGNISFNTSEDTIRDFFSKVGEITSIRMARGDDGRPKGFCHIDFATVELAKEAI